ncbi:MAG: glycosyl hydrolase-related protein, partial [Candidatus Gallimonas sp.]
KGDAYVYRVSPEKPLLLNPVSFEKPVSGAFRESLTLSYDYDCPACYDFARDCRAEEKVKNEVRVTFTLEKGNETIGISYRIVNRARDHRIRILLKSGFAGGKLFTDSPFDFAERESCESCDETESDTHHNSTFTRLTQGGRSLIAYTEGQYETERTGEGLAFTLLRATGVINRNATTFLPAGGAQWNVPENQILRTVEGRMGAEYSAGRDGADCYVRGKFFRNGLICHADSFDPKKYSGGRFAVQTAELERLYYLKDKYAECRLSPESLFTCDCPSVVVTCRKKGEKGGTLLRFVNLSDKVQNAEFAFRGKMYVTNMSEREETCAGEKCARLTFSPKQIITVRFTDV